MSRTVKVTLYQFDELSDAAKETARQWWRECIETADYADFVLEDFGRVCEVLGVAVKCRESDHGECVYWSGFSYQGDGASFEGSYCYMPGSRKRIREYAPLDKRLHRIADDLADMQRRHFYRLSATITKSGYYQHSGTMDVAVEDGRGVEVWGDAAEVVTDAMRALADWLYGELNRAFWSAMEDDNVDENICINEYDFTVDGKRASRLLEGSPAVKQR